MPESDLALLVEAATHAGTIAMKHWRSDPDVWDKGDDNPVSEADLAVDRFLKETLLAARPGYGWLSEETPDGPERLSKERVFVVDPIDGTRAFVGGQPTWAHSLAVVEAGTPLAACILLPARDWVYAAARGQGATKNGAPIRVSGRKALAGATLFSNKTAFDPKYWTTPPEDINRSFRPSLAYRMAAVAEARVDGMITFRDTWEWDIAAGALIAAEAGAHVTDQNGAPLVFNNAHPQTPGTIVAPPALHAALMDRRNLS